jgi:hypothetical protein
MIRIETREDARQFADLSTAPGVPDSGRLRYAAAMYFHRRGMIGERTLEVFRVCAKLHDEDPRATLERLGLAAEVPTPAEVERADGGRRVT